MSERPDSQDPDRDPGLDRAYRAVDREEPPARLDDAIRAAARREVGARPQPAGGGGLRAWRVPVSIAAMLVVGVSIVTLVREEHPQVLEVPSPVPAAQAPAPEAAQPPKTLRDAPAEQQATTAAGAGRASDEVARPLPAQPAPETRLSAPSAAAKEEAGSPKRDRSNEQDAARNESEPRAEQARRAPQAFGPSDPPAATAQIQSAAAPAAADSKGQSAPRPQTLADAAPATPAAEGRMAPRAKAQADNAYAEFDTPEKWLDRIRDLRKQDRQPEAAKLLAEFRQRYPGYALPPDLKEGIKP